MSPGFRPVPWRAILIQCHKVARPFVSVFVEVGGVCVIPVLLKLLPEDTFSCELLLGGGKQRVQHKLLLRKSGSWLTMQEIHKSNSDISLEISSQQQIIDKFSIHKWKELPVGDHMGKNFDSAWISKDEWVWYLQSHTAPLCHSSPDRVHCPPL